MPEERSLEKISGKSSEEPDEGLSSPDGIEGESVDSIDIQEIKETKAPPPLPRAPERKDAPRTASSQAQAVKRLETSIGMALPKNRYRIFIGKGTIPPVNEVKQFVAPLADINKVRIRILEGDDPQADRNLFLGDIGINHIELRDDGKAEIELDFSLNARGILSVRLVDRIGRTEGFARFVPFQFRREVSSNLDVGRLPIDQLNQKLSLLEEQMQILKGELEVRGEGQ